MPSTGLTQTADRSAEHGSLSVHVSGLKSDKGVLRWCVAPRGSGFPECDAKLAMSGSAEIHDKAANFTVRNMHSGDYAVAVFHDANGNNKLDTFAGIPKEGYGFSRNPGFKPRAPRFEEAVLTVAKGTEADIKLRYIF
jgi:uncharacterized protein (DUF2141 family)